MSKEFAPGIKRSHYPGNIQKLKPGQLLDYVIQRHDATRRGVHRDFRIGNKHMGMFSWALNTAALPQEGERIPAIRTNLHTHAYKDWEGIIPAGKYGAGRVSKQEEGKVLITNTSPKHVSFSIVDKKHPERFTLVNPYAGREWMLLKQKTPAAPGAEKAHYKNVSEEKIEDTLKHLKPGSEVQPKIDGALQFLNLINGKTEMLSHRISKVTDKPVVHTERFFGKIPHLDLPKELRNSVLLTEVYGERNGKAIPNAELGGILNSSVENALEAQKNKDVKIKAMLFDIAKLHGEKVDAPYAARKELLKEFIKYLPKGKFEIPEGVHTSEDAIKLYKQIVGGKHPLTAEGVVIHPPTGVPAKHKIMPEADVWIKGFFPAEKGSKYEGKAVGGFQYSHTLKGPIAGKVGTGLTDDMRKLMHEHPDWFIARVAKIKSHEKFVGTGAHRVPVFLGLHEDYGPKSLPPKEKKANEVEETFNKWKAALPQEHAQHLQLASGYPHDVGKISDVDVLHLLKDGQKPADILKVLGIKSHGGEYHELGAYDGRPINLMFGSGPRAERALTHRANELALAKKHPELLEKVKALKLKGVKTEPAWAQVLGLKGDPYEAMANLPKQAQDLTKLAPKWNSPDHLRIALVEHLAGATQALKNGQNLDKEMVDLSFITNAYVKSQVGRDLLQKRIAKFKETAKYPSLAAK